MPMWKTMLAKKKKFRSLLNGGLLSSYSSTAILSLITTMNHHHLMLSYPVLQKNCNTFLGELIIYVPKLVQYYKTKREPLDCWSVFFPLCSTEKTVIEDYIECEDECKLRELTGCA